MSDPRPLLCRALLVFAGAILPCVALAELTVGVSWSNFQEERWKTDEAALVQELERRGARYVSADAQSSVEKQTADIESLVARGVDVLIVLPQDADALMPVVRRVQREGIPVIAYDRLIELPDVLYISFDNVEVGRIQARAIHQAKPRGRYVFIKGGQQDPNSHFVFRGQLDVLGPRIEAGEIEVVGDQFVDGWLPEVAQRVTEQILTSNDDAVDAIVCSNDGMAGGVIAALAARGLEGIPVSGQDGDLAALHRIARGTQTVSVWKDSRRLGRLAADAALRIGHGAEPGEIDGTEPFRNGPRSTVLDALLLEPVAITRDNLELVIDSGWVPREAVCRGPMDDPPPACATP